MDDIKPGEKVWIEIDNKPGLTSGDEVVNPGDTLKVDQVVKRGDCEEWYDTHLIIFEWLIFNRHHLSVGNRSHISEL